jgi:hypothetical protein
MAMDRGRAALARILRTLPLIAVVGLVFFLLFPYLQAFKNFMAATSPQTQPSPSSGYKLVGVDELGHEVFQPINDLPPDPPQGYFYIRAQKLANGKLSPILQKSQCVSECDSDNSLWLVPKPNY